MVLGGQFDYEEDNQRALPFSVKITEINEEMKVHRGSTSESVPRNSLERLLAVLSVSLAMDQRMSKRERELGGGGEL